jgi:hypothetical protein
MSGPSETAESGQDSKPADNLVDLSAIAEKYPVNQRVAVLDMSTFDASKLSLLDVLDMAEKAGVEPENLAGLLNLGKNSARKARMLVSLAWVIARRAEPGLTYEEVSTWRIQMRGKIDPELVRRNAARDKAITAAAEVAGVPPSEAGKLTVGELSAIHNRQERRARARKRR